jgi:hypothetical protein
MNFPPSDSLRDRELGRRTVGNDSDSQLERYQGGSPFPRKPSSDFHEMVWGRNFDLHSPRGMTNTMDQNKFSTSSPSEVGPTGATTLDTPMGNLRKLLTPTTLSRILSPPPSLSRDEIDDWNELIGQLKNSSSHVCNSIIGEKGTVGSRRMWGSHVGTSSPLTGSLISPDKHSPAGGMHQDSGRALSPQTGNQKSQGGSAIMALVAPRLDTVSPIVRTGGSSSLRRSFLHDTDRKHKRTVDALDDVKIAKKLRREGGFVIEKSGNTSKTREQSLSCGFPMPSLDVSDNNCKERTVTPPSLSSFRYAWQVLLQRSKRNGVGGVLVDAAHERRLIRESFGRALAFEKIPHLRESSNST